MKGILLGTSLVLGILAFTGCGQDTLTISKCLKYDKGMCVSKKQQTIVKCNNPIVMNGTTYCSK